MTIRPDGPGPWWATTDPTDTLSVPVCGVCGSPSIGDPDDVPGPPQGPMCGACARAREFDQTQWELDLADPDAGLW